MGDGKVRVLLIEDDPDDYLLTRELLTDIPPVKFSLEWASNFDEGLNAIARGEHDVYLVDYRLGQHDGLELLREALLKHGCNAPFIVLTGQGDPDVDRQAMEAGASDFLVKGRIDAAALERAIRYAISQKHAADELERKIQERTAELAQANELLREADRRKNEYLAVLAHELRNPLAPISNALHIIRRTDDAATIKSVSEIMERQVAQMVRLVDDLLDVSRISQGKIELRRERVELAAVVAEAVEAVRPLCVAMNHELSVSLPPQPIVVSADTTRLAQILGNLLNNACKFTDRGGRIRLEVERESGQGVIRVRDNGIGIEEDQLPRLFDLFMQADTSLGRPHSGLGIGLMLVKRLVELHGGAVMVSSAGLGQGSEFVVRLPVLEGTAAA